jgi:hypothetical protein
VAEVAPGHLHDLTLARNADVIGALNWAACQLNLPALADSGYDGAGQGIKTPIKQRLAAARPCAGPPTGWHRPRQGDTPRSPSQPGSTA